VNVAGRIVLRETLGPLIGFIVFPAALAAMLIIAS
jgi:hypothetical protein